jgi:hypothetical protein
MHYFQFEEIINKTTLNIGKQFNKSEKQFMIRMKNSVESFTIKKYPNRNLAAEKFNE